MRTSSILIGLLTLALAGPTLADEPELADALITTWELDAAYPAARDALLVDPVVSDDALVALAEHPDFRVRAQAAVLLGWRHDVDLFVDVWTAVPVNSRRNRQQRFVGEVFLDPAARPAVVERLVHGLDGSLAQAGLVRSLPALGEDWADDAVALLGELDDPRARSAAVTLMRRADGDAALVGLELGLADESPEVRAQAARMAGFRADGDALASQLIEAVGDHDAPTRAAAARALGWLQLSEARSVLAAATSDSDPEVRLHALRSLDRVDAEAANELPGLLGLASDSDPKVARVARRILSR